ncbi:YceI family protein [Namhaeicola litoreus]|uniref:YceI family protein n=1 Tax=Namhaeicola litoreus TaxID=1052145 RepID=A0ABW3Y795_9FLAO
MRKKIIYILLVGVLFTSFSCKKANKEEVIEEKISSYILSSDSINLEWTAYKTTEKVPVKGTFTKIELINIPSGKNPQAVAGNVEFSIPIESIFTKDTIRDGKLKKFFFGNLMGTSNITGKTSLKEDGTGEATITMNGVEKTVPVTFTTNGNDVEINANLDLDNWQAQMALTALNEACYELHKGADGVSKTWNTVDVLVKVSTKLQP